MRTTLAILLALLLAVSSISCGSSWAQGGLTGGDGNPDGEPDEDGILFGFIDLEADGDVQFVVGGSTVIHYAAIDSPFTPGEARVLVLENPEIVEGSELETVLPLWKDVTSEQTFSPHQGQFFEPRTYHAEGVIYVAYKHVAGVQETYYTEGQYKVIGPAANR